MTKEMEGFLLAAFAEHVWDLEGTREGENFLKAAKVKVVSLELSIFSAEYDSFIAYARLIDNKLKEICSLGITSEDDL